jgi:outer membrane protein assembly factor BamB
VSRRFLAALAALAAVTTAAPVLANGPGQLPCSGSDPGGAWPTYGHDQAGSRSQPLETSLAPTPASGLTKKWSFTTNGGLESAPIVAHGCVYLTTTSGEAYAVSAATGQQVWRHTFADVSTAEGGVIPGAPTVVGDQLIVLISRTGSPYAASLDARTGVIRWTSAPISQQDGTFTNASAAVDRGVLVYGYSPTEGADTGQGGVALLDVRNGALLADVPTVAPAHQAQGYAGGGIWATPVFDDNGYAYVGAGNPDSKMLQDPHTDAILKIDVDRHRATFGQIVGYNPGNVDQYSDTLQQLSQTPVCAASDSTGLPWPIDDPACGQLDLDYGASPNLIPDGAGGLLVGELQKSGEYHAAHTGDMSSAWQATVGVSCEFCNAATSAYDGTTVYVLGTPAGLLWALDPRTGATKWVTPAGDAVHYQSLSVANGVVYTVDVNGFLDGWSAADGTPLLKQPMDVDVSDVTGGLSSSGVTIADHTVFAAASTMQSSGAGYVPGTSGTGYLVAYAPK